jgi:hypothetical protein
MQLDAENRTEQGVSCDRKLSHCWDDELKRAVFEKAISARGYWRSKSFEQMAAVLLSHGYAPMRQALAERVEAVAGGSDDDPKYAQIAAAGLVGHSEDAAWPLIWPAVLANKTFGRDLLMTIAHGLHHNTGGFASKLTDAQLGDLFIWLVREFPYSQDRQHEGVYSPAVRELRNGISRFLEEKGTSSAVVALQSASMALPDLSWLASVVVEARKNMLQKTWIPLDPDALLEVVAKPSAALVRNADELQSLLVEAIGVLEGRLQGETPQAFALWDQTDRSRGNERFRPKDENHLSDWLKASLEAELAARSIVVAREVEIRRGEGQGKGERTDIHVTAIIPSVEEQSSGRAMVIIETKGCWNPELLTAMRGQLVDRYLKDNQCRHGIYLVGWYMCDQWDDDQGQKRSTPDWCIEEAREFFDAQAKEMPPDVAIEGTVIDARLR